MPAEIIVTHRLPIPRRVGYNGPNYVHYVQSHDSARSLLKLGADLIVIEGDYFYVSGLARDAKNSGAVTLQYSSGLVREPDDYLDGCVPRDGMGGDSILNDLVLEKDLRRMLKRLDPEELGKRFPEIAWYRGNFRKKWFGGSGR